MRLTDLQPIWLAAPRRDEDGHEIWPTLTSKDGAHGIEFLCPACFTKNNGPVGTHAIICWDPSISQDHHPKPGRWQLVGTSFDDLTLVAGSSSISLPTADCKAHFFIRNGDIVPC